MASEDVCSRSTIQNKLLSHFIIFHVDTTKSQLLLLIIIVQLKKTYKKH